MPYLIVNTENEGCQIYHLRMDASLGRHPHNDIVLKGHGTKTISRHHAKLQRDAQGFELVDSSLNGTRVNNEKIKSHRLSNGDLFEIGDYTITFVEDAGPECQEMQVAESVVGETEEVVRCDSIVDAIPDQQLKTELKNEGIIIEDQRMVALYKDIRNVAGINVPVLILGEPGTGKEKVAQALHKFSKAQGEFVPLNCSAIPENLFESELFGSVKGAFSDAETKPGKFELADNGTLFLDEIGDMSLTCQPKLLRFLECRSISRLGETQTRELNIRIVAATNQDLSKMAEAKTFRSDLFQRLACIKLKIPPLRERKKDILPLAKYFLANYAEQYSMDPMTISRQASQIMTSYYWPGNVRELANIILNVYVRSSGDVITADHLTTAAEEMDASGEGHRGGFPSLKDMEKLHIQKAMEQTENNKSKAASLLGISRDTLYKKIQKYQIMK